MSEQHKPDPEFVKYFEDKIGNPFIDSITMMRMEKVHIDQRKKYETKLDQARQIITDLIDFCEQPEIVAATDGAFDPDAVIQRGKRFLSGGEENAKR